MKAMGCVLLVLCLAVGANAGDLGFRYKNGQCVNAQGQTGRNPSFLGQCADLNGVRLSRFDFSEIDFSGSVFENADLQQSSLKKSILVGVSFVGAQLSGVDFTEARIEAVNFTRAVLRNVSFAEASIVRSDFSLVDFRGAQLSYFSAQDSLFVGTNFSNCSIDSASFVNGQLKGAKFIGANLSASDLTGADVTWASFESALMTGTKLKSIRGSETQFRSAQMKTADLTSASLEKANFRLTNLNQAILQRAKFSAAEFAGADLTQATYEQAVWTGSTFSKKTVFPFSADDAIRLGMSLLPFANVLVIWDDQTEYFNRFLASFSSEAYVTKTKEAEAKFDGSELSKDIDVVLHFNSSSGYGHDIPATGQTAIVNFVKGGGTYAYTAWNEFSLSQGFLKGLSEVLIKSHNYANTGTAVRVDAAQRGHPLLADVEAQFNVTGPLDQGALRTFSENPPTVLISTTSGSPVVATRKLGSGTVISVGFACSYQQGTCFDDKNIRTLFRNIIMK